MGVKVSAFASQDEQRQQFGIQARRGNVILDETLVRAVNGLLQLHRKHLANSTQQISHSGEPGKNGPWIVPEVRFQATDAGRN
jgi:hypothetical protein